MLQLLRGRCRTKLYPRCIVVSVSSFWKHNRRASSVVVPPPSSCYHHRRATTIACNPQHRVTTIIVSTPLSRFSQSCPPPLSRWLNTAFSEAKDLPAASSLSGPYTVLCLPSLRPRRGLSSIAIIRTCAQLYSCWAWRRVWASLPIKQACVCHQPCWTWGVV